MFEAGALARGVSKDRVCTILFDIKNSDVRGPLAGRQHVEVTEEGFRKLLKTINNGNDDKSKLSETELNEMFNLVWDKLKQSIDAITAAPQPALKKPSPDELLQEILGVVRNFSILQEKLIRALSPPPVNPQLKAAAQVYGLGSLPPHATLDVLTGKSE